MDAVTLYMLLIYSLDNLVEGFALINLTDSDISTMLPGKVGAVRKLCVLRAKLVYHDSLSVSVTSTLNQLDTSQSSLPALVVVVLVLM
jgi:hypothetical protein